MRTMSQMVGASYRCRGISGATLALRNCKRGVSVAPGAAVGGLLRLILRRMRRVTALRARTLGLEGGCSK